MNSFLFNAIKTLQSNTFLGLIVGENIITLQRTSSTNDYLKSYLSNSTPHTEGTVIMAVEQYAGKGQAGGIWKSEVGKNLTCSVLLNPEFLLPKEQFQLNIAVSLAIIGFLNTKLKGNFSIKWPNDIYYEDKKLAGILIENILRGTTWKHAIIGIGLNVNQTNFEVHSSKACSLKQSLHKDLEVSQVLKGLCSHLTHEYHLLKHGGASQQRERYKSCLYKMGKQHSFLVDGKMMDGTIIDITDEGKLVVDFDGKLTDFGIKEIAFS